MIADKQPKKKTRNIPSAPKVGWLTGQKRPCNRHFFEVKICKDMKWLREVAVEMKRLDVIRDIDSGKLKRVELQRCKCGGYKPQEGT